MSRYFLGLDASTQSMSAMVIDLEERSVVYEHTLNFDECFPSYGTVNGVLRDTDPRVVHAPPLMWLDALDAIFQCMADEDVPLDQLGAISGSGQQHGTVYLNEKANDHLDAGRGNLVHRLGPALSRPTSPIWMDSSTTAECEEIRAALGGMERAVKHTGSDIFERFSGPQIRKFFKQDPDGYGRTHHIALVSSFLSSVLLGKVSPIDHGDGTGMNLADIASLQWSPEACEATAPGLRQRLPALEPSHHVLGPTVPYFQERYGVNPRALTVVWSGDNPNSLVGVGLVRPGMRAISLGTSDTYFGAMGTCHTDPRGEGHVFGSPAGGYMTLLCFKNGSLARERIKERYHMDWGSFSAAIEATPPGNQGRIMLPYFEPEIVPHVLNAGVRRIGGLTEDDGPANCRAVVEAQMLSMRIHSEWMGERPSRIYATGGASANQTILQVMADVHQAPVYRFEATNSAALGAALRAAHAYRTLQGTISWEDITEGFAEPVESSRTDPRPESREVYDQMADAYREAERAHGIT
jgi:xylulokinase